MEIKQIINDQISLKSFSIVQTLTTKCIGKEVPKFNATIIFCAASNDKKQLQVFVSVHTTNIENSDTITDEIKEKYKYAMKFIVVSEYYINIPEKYDDDASKVAFLETVASRTVAHVVVSNIRSYVRDTLFLMGENPNEFPLFGFFTTENDGILPDKSTLSDLFRKNIKFTDLIILKNKPTEQTT